MKKLQRFGIVSLAALTLASLTLANDQLVKADETTPAETTVETSNLGNSDSISDTERKSIKLQVEPWTNFGDYLFEHKVTIEVKAGETVTIKPKEIEGYTPFQKDGVTLTYDQLLVSNKNYKFYYVKNNSSFEEVTEPTENFSITHILDDGSEPIEELQPILIEKVRLKFGDSPIYPEFKMIDGWLADEEKSYVKKLFYVTSLRSDFKQGNRFDYGLTDGTIEVVLVYKKAGTKVEEPKEPDTTVDTKPSQPTDPDTSTPTDNTTGNTGRVDGENPTDPTASPTTDTTVDNGGTSDAGDDGNHTEESANGSETSPVTPLSNNDGENPTDPTAPPTTDTTLDNGGTSDAGDDANAIAPNKPEDTGIILPPITPDDVVNKDESESVFPNAILDSKADKSTSPEADNNFASNNGESQTKPVKKESLSRVESRHLPKTSDSHNLLAVLGVTILTTLGLYRPSKRQL